MRIDSTLPAVIYTLSDPCHGQHQDGYPVDATTTAWPWSWWWSVVGGVVGGPVAGARATVTSLCRAPHLDIQTHVGTPKVIAKIFLYETNHNRSNTSRIAAHRSSHKQYTHTMMAMALLSSGGF